jgi:hypothetical protein
MTDRLESIMAGAFASLSGRERAAMVSHAGSVAAARVMAFEAMPEAQRMEAVRNAGAVPDACGSAIPEAPARGPVKVFDFYAAYPKGAEEVEFKPGGFAGRRSMRVGDVFDRMGEQARRRGGQPTLTPSQVAMGRAFATMVQDHVAGAMRCSSVEALPGGGGSREGFTDHRLSLSRKIDTLQARIGMGTALVVARVRPSKRGEGRPARRNLPDLDLVRRVCVDDQDISAVLEAYGWSVKGDTVKALTLALSQALDRMIGPPRRHDIQVIRYCAPRNLVQKGA